MKKLLLFGIPLLLLLGVGGAGAYYFLYLEPGAETAEPEPPPPPADPILLAMDPMTIPVIRQGAVRKYVLVKLTLQVSDADARTLAAAVMPRIKDEAYTALHRYFASIPLDAPISTRAIKNRVSKIVLRNIGSEAFQRVLIEGVYEKQGG